MFEFIAYTTLKKAEKKPKIIKGPIQMLLSQ